MSNEDQIQIIKSNKRNNFVMLPYIAHNELDPYETKLLIHYLKGCYAGGGQFQQGARATALSCKMGVNTVGPVQKRLEEKGYIKLEHGIAASDALTITVLEEEMWMRNQIAYADDDSRQNLMTAWLVEAIKQPNFEEVAKLAVSRIRDDLSRISDAGVTNQGRGVTDKGQLIYVELLSLISYSLREIEAKEKATDEGQGLDEEDEAPAPDPTPEPPKKPRYDPLKENGIKAGDAAAIYGAGNGTKTAATKIADSKIALLILGSFPDFVMSAHDTELLTKAVTVEADGHTETYPAAEYLYSTETKFQVFVESRIKLFRAMKDKPNNTMKITAGVIVRNILNYDKVNQNKPLWNGWLAFKAEQDMLAVKAGEKQAERRVEIIEVPNLAAVNDFSQYAD
jgi:hypothetical protein